MPTVDDDGEALEVPEAPTKRSTNDLLPEELQGEVRLAPLLFFC